MKCTGPARDDDEEDDEDEEEDEDECGEDVEYDCCWVGEDAKPG